MKAKKDLSDMSLSELWQLFPIFLTEHKKEWQSWFQEERAMLESCLSQVCNIRISHIGSTAIEDISAKPTIDILVEIDKKFQMDDLVEKIISAGYTLTKFDKNCISFHKGYTLNGFAKKVFHLHLRYYGDNDELYFRDYLNEHLDTAREYEQLKFSLYRQYAPNRDAYTDGKTCFVKSIVQKAVLLYADRYRK